MARALAPLYARLRRPAELDVVGVGECSLDEVWRLDGDLLPGGKHAARSPERLGGGQVATLLVALARLGRQVAFAGAVGEDEDGARLLEELAGEGVAVERATRVPGAGTRRAVLVVDGAGDRTVIEHRDARLRPAPERVAAAVGRAAIVHLDAVDLEVSIEVAERARAAGAIVSLDVDRAAPGLDALLALADVCVVSADVPLQLGGDANLFDALERLAPRTGPLLCATAGESGAFARVGGQAVHVPAFAVEVVDTTACGDTFRAGLLCALLEQQPLAAALRFAAAAAALKCRDLGRRGCPRRAEVDAFLSTRTG
jgi:ribokinase